MAPAAAPVSSTATDSTAPWTGRLLTAILAGGIAVRVVAAVVLVAGPWTDTAAELAGWDVARFQEIADAPGRHWVDHDVEYPPGSVLVIETLAQDSVVQTHQILAVSALAVDLGVALLLALAAGRHAAATYLVLGLPLVPAGLVRLDVLSVALALMAAITLVGRPEREGAPLDDGRPTSRPAAFAAFVTAAALVKVWPGLLVAGAVALGRRAAALAAAAVMAIAGIAWLLYGGLSLEPIDQVLSLRGATGWHVESLGGTITALTSDADAERQLDAFRIGELNPAVVAAGRAVTVAVVVGFGWLVHRRRAARSDLAHDRSAKVAAADLYALSLFMLGSTAALLVTAPLLSPQFLLWLTPWAAVIAARGERWSSPTVLLTGAVTVLTGSVLAYFGPPDVAAPTPAALLLVRNLALVALVAAAALELRPPTGGPDASVE